MSELPDPPAPDAELQVILRWIDKAESDILVAHHTLTLSDYDCPFEVAAFHAQQAAEKYLKALLLFRGQDAPHTHDIRLLTRRLEVVGALPDGLAVDALRELTRYAVDTRYPDDIDPVDRIEAERAVQLAETVRIAVLALLPLTSPDKE